MSGPTLVDVLAMLRDGMPPEPEALAWFAGEIGADRATEAQLGAFAMGVCRTPLTLEGRAALMRGMRDSGTCLRWDLPGPVLDKHSTGGVGDCVSLALAPALAACGAYVPMLSGRGLGHTGGTMDKLEAIPGFRTDLDEPELRRVVSEVGCAIAGATEQIAPADRRLYAVRDVTGTVPSLDLIVASILSKKLAGGASALVLDVKVGSGAFMKDMERARDLAQALVVTAKAAGCPCTALITDMDQPLVTAVGNALEVIEVMETLTVTYVTSPLWALTERLGAEVLVLAGRAQSLEDGAAQIHKALESGRAAEIFGQMVAAQGGPRDFLEHWRDRLPAAPTMYDVAPTETGFVARVDGEALGRIVVDLGGGRLRATDRIDPAVGLSHVAGIGEEVGPTRPFARIHAADRTAAEAMEARVRAAFALGPGPENPPPLVRERVA